MVISFFLIILDCVDFPDVVGNDEQLFALCLTVFNDLSKNGFSLSSFRRK